MQILQLFKSKLVHIVDKNVTDKFKTVPMKITQTCACPKQSFVYNNHKVMFRIRNIMIVNSQYVQMFKD